MQLLFKAAVLCLTLGLRQCAEETTQENTVHRAPQAESSYSDWGIETIRDSFETVNSYFDSFLELQVLEKSSLLGTSRGRDSP